MERKSPDNENRRLTVGFLAAAAVASYIFAPHIDDMVLPSSPTSQEAAIAAALGTVYSDDVITVHCSTQERIQAIALQPSSSIKLRGVAVFFSGHVWIRQDQCDHMSTIATNPPRMSADGGLQETLQLANQAASVRTLAHENAHSVGGVIGESKAECEAARTAGMVAVALGMDKSLEEAFQSYVVDYQRQHQLMLGPQYAFSDDCVVGAR